MVNNQSFYQYFNGFMCKNLQFEITCVMFSLKSVSFPISAAVNCVNTDLEEHRAKACTVTGMCVCLSKHLEFAAVKGGYHQPCWTWGVEGPPHVPPDHCTYSRDQQDTCHHQQHNWQHTRKKHEVVLESTIRT